MSIKMASMGQQLTNLSVISMHANKHLKSQRRGRPKTRSSEVRCVTVLKLHLHREFLVQQTKISLQRSRNIFSRMALSMTTKEAQNTVVILLKVLRIKITSSGRHSSK